MIGLVKLRILETDKKFRMRGATLANAIMVTIRFPIIGIITTFGMLKEDRNMGLIPFFVSATLGTTSCCSFDALHEIGSVAQV